MAKSAKDYRLPMEKVQALRDHQRDVNDLLSVIDKLEDCGEDCTSDRQLIAAMNERMTKILTHFGPPVS